MFSTFKGNTMKIDKYAGYMDGVMRNAYDYHKYYGRVPLFRYHSFKKAFEIFSINSGKTIVELGTLRSYVHGGLEGCNSDDTKYWTPDRPENWDWGAGLFSLMAAEEFCDSEVDIHTVDICQAHINRSKVISKKFSDAITYHVSDSVSFLESFESKYDKKIDLLYVDTGDMTPIEPTAHHQLKEAEAIIKSGVLTDNGIILIDDVRNAAPIILCSETDLHGKAKYSIPYLVNNGFEILMDEYQVLMRRKI
jgi:hypothetical protein